MVCVLLGFFITFVCEKQSPYRPSVVYRLTPVFKWQIVVWCNFLIEYDKKTISIFPVDWSCPVFVACGQRGNDRKEEVVQENLEAKKNLQGIWLDDDGDDVAFRIKGDSVFFPDSTSMPAYFRVEKDSFVVVGGNTVKYHIVKQTPHLFVFVNQNGERVKLVKTDDESYLDLFAPKTFLAVNQNRIVKRDTVLYHGAEKYHCYVQVNPTTYKVVKSTFNDDGVEVGNVYYDNIVNLGVFNGARRLFSSDFRKQDFQKNIPSDILRQLVLSDITFNKANEEGMHFYAVLVIPETSISYIVELVVTYDGKIIKRIKK